MWFKVGLDVQSLFVFHPFNIFPAEWPFFGYCLQYFWKPFQLLLTSSAPPRRKPAKRKLKVNSLNCNGLKGSAKRSEFQSHIELQHPDIVLECGSKLDAYIPTYWTFQESYNIFRKDRSSSGGGVCPTLDNLAVRHTNQHATLISVSTVFV